MVCAAVPLLLHRLKLGTCLRCCWNTPLCCRMRGSEEPEARTPTRPPALPRAHCIADTNMKIRTRAACAKRHFGDRGTLFLPVFLILPTRRVVNNLAAQCSELYIPLRAACTRIFLYFFPSPFFSFTLSLFLFLFFALLSHSSYLFRIFLCFAFPFSSARFLFGAHCATHHTHTHTHKRTPA